MSEDNRASGIRKYFMFFRLFFPRLWLPFKVIISFLKLKHFVNKFDSVGLLSQLSLTFLIKREGEFVTEGSEAINWARWLEFLTGLLLGKKRNQNSNKVIIGQDIERIEKLLKDYFASINMFIIISGIRNKNNKSIITSVKLFSLYVRGESYPFLLYQMGLDLYSKFDSWFLKNLGFTIEDAIKISKSIKSFVEERINNEKQNRRQEAKKIVDELLNAGELSEEKIDETEMAIWCSLYFGKSEEIISFSISEISEFSGIEIKVCENFFSRLSQDFGYRNKNFKNTFTNPYKAPWDYNTLNEKPIIRFNETYFIPVMSLVPEVLVNTFYFDLLQDKEYWTKTGEKIYGRWLEERTAKCLLKVFPQSSVFKNPYDDKGKELTDVIILYDRKVFIIQCKTKRLLYESKIGIDFKKLKSDLYKGIKSSFKQAVNAKDYIFNQKFPKLVIQEGEIIIDREQISTIFLMSVTFYGFQNITTRLANYDDSLNLSIDNQFPWAISLFDLEILCEILDKPWLFIHYAQRRIQLEKTLFNIDADEIDMLGVYLSQGMYFEDDDFKDISTASFSGFSNSIDEYYFRKFEELKTPKKPAIYLSKYESKFLETINGLDSPYKTDCIMSFLDMAGESRRDILEKFENLKKQTRKDGQLHSISTVMDDGKVGLSFITMDSKRNRDDVFQQLFAFSSMKKYQERCIEWVGIGWCLHSLRLVDMAIYLNEVETYDPVKEEISQTILKPGSLLSK